jgi:hypothetical protein
MVFMEEMATANRRRIAWMVTLLAVPLIVAWWLAARDSTPSVAVERPHPAASEPEATKPRAQRVRDEAEIAPASAVDAAPPVATASDETPKETFPLVVTVLRSDGTPAAAAEVRLLNPDDDAPCGAAQADERGVASMRAPSGLARVAAWLGAEAAAEPGLVDPSETHAATVRLEPAIVVHGRTVLLGHPAVGTRVHLSVSPWLGSEFDLALGATSDADGKFAFQPIATRGLAGAESRAIAAETESLATGHADLDAESLRRGDEVVVEMKPSFTVRARFVDAEGKPVDDVIVTRSQDHKPFAHGDSDGRVELVLPDVPVVSLVARWRTERTEIVGYTRDGGTYSAIWYVATRLPDVKRAAGDVDLGDVTIRAGRPVKGVVVDGTGAPSRHAHVSLWLGGIQIAEAPTSDDGRFTLPEVGPDAHRVGVRESVPEDSPAPGRRQIVDGVHGGDPDLRIVLEDSFAIRFRFLSADDRKPLSCAQFNIRAKHHGDGFDWFPFQNAGDPVDSFDFDTISGGTFDVEIDVAGYEPQRFESVEVAAAAPTVLDLLLRKKHE